MKDSCRFARRQQGAVRGRVAGLTACLALVAATVLGIWWNTGGRSDSPPRPLARTAAQERVMEATPPVPGPGLRSSPRQPVAPYAYEDSGSLMFTLAPDGGRGGAASLPVPVRMNRKAAERAARTGFMEVGLADGTRYRVLFERMTHGPRNTMTWIGRVATPAGDLAAVLTYGRDGVFGVLPTPEGHALQVKTSRGQAVLVPDPGLVPPGVDPHARHADYVIPPVPRAAGPQSRMHAGAPLAGSSEAGTHATSTARQRGGRVMQNAGTARDASTTEIVVLGVYTTNLVSERGSVAAAETEFVNLLEIANQAHIDSGTRVRLVLGGLLETDYPPNAFNAQALDDVTNNTLPDGLDIFAARNARSADLVAMLRPYAPDDPSCGIAYLNGGGLAGSYASSSYGFSVTACGAYTMAHEIGHNLGSAHDREAMTVDGTLGYGAFDFSFGYRYDANPAFATIMAYGLEGQARVGYFSSPGRTACLGLPCGIRDQADNVRSMNLMADTIARFRDPVGTVSILDARTTEGDGGGVWLEFVVRISNPVPAGMLRFDVATTSGGTATAGQDYVADAMTNVEFPEGQREWTFKVQVLPDTLVEGDETVQVRLANVTGLPVYDGEAEGLIVDDDPRPTVSGVVQFADGEVRPPSVQVYAFTRLHGMSEVLWTTATAPDYTFRLDVVRGSQVDLNAEMPEESPWVSGYARLAKVERDVTANIPIGRGVRISGRIRWPAGESPAEQIPLQLTAFNITGDTNGYGLTAYPPDYTYSIKSRDRTPFALALDFAPWPYLPQRVEGYTRGDTTQDITLSTLPSLTVAHQRVLEGKAGEARTVEIAARLSVPAPAAGVSFDLATEDGTASGQSDYLPETRAATISEGNRWFFTSVVIVGDNHPEPEEYFRIVARNLRGAHMPSPGIVRIRNDDAAAPTPTRFDFDADGRSDLTWHHAGNGRGVLWGGAQYANKRELTTVTDTRWGLVGAGDFDGDGHADLVWRHGASGQNAIWRRADNGAVLRMQAVTNLDWTVAGIADFDGDRRDDVLWRNRRTGANVIWRGADYRMQTPVTGVTNLDWTVAGVGDFDGDRRADILWRHSRTGANVIWRGGEHSRQQRVVGVTDVRWRVAASADFDGDGRADLLWRHAATGANVIWKGADHGAQQSVTGVTNLDWQVATVGDYSGDGRADIVWRNTRSGANTLWRAADYRDQTGLATVSGSAWRVVN